MTNDTVEVDRDYLWALEVLALDYLRDSEPYEDFEAAKGVVESANLNRPRDRSVSDSSGGHWHGNREGQQQR